MLECFLSFSDPGNVMLECFLLFSDPGNVMFECFLSFSYSSGGEDGYVRSHVFDKSYYDFEFEY